MNTHTGPSIRGFLFAFLAIALLVQAGQLHEKKQEQLAASAQARDIPGGVTFQVPLPVDKAFEIVLTGFKRQMEVDSADKEVGRIITAMQITGGYSQTGTRTIVNFIKDTDAQTSVRVAVSKQKRKKLLQTEPWSDPKLDPEASAKAADEVKTMLNQAEQK